MILFVLIGILLFTQTILDETADTFYKTHYKEDPIIYDVAHLYFTYIDCEQLMNMYLIAFIILFIPVWKEFLEMIMPIFLLRAITVHLTVLPKKVGCDISKQNKMFGGCYDKIFSGHFSIILLGTLLLKQYHYINIYTFVLANALNALLILCSRSHYTVDLVVSMLATFYVYHQKIKIVI
jgi:hypothetical protein